MSGRNRSIVKFAGVALVCSIARAAAAFGAATSAPVMGPALPPIPGIVANVATATLSLDGDWTFQTDDHAEAKSIAVPGEWTMQGFAVPAGGFATYRRSIDVPADWQGGPIGLRFDAVHAVCEVQVNGRAVGGHVGGFVPFELDVTDAIRPDAANEIIVRVQCESDADTIACVSQYAAHPVGGIIRSVHLLRRPATYLSELSTQVSQVDAKQHTAKLHIHSKLNDHGFGKAVTVTHRLIDLPTHRVITADAGSAGEATIDVSDAKLWTSETPYRYMLQTTVQEDGHQTEIIRRRVGLREVHVDGDRLLINGSPVKLLGVNRHEVQPLTGRSMSAELCRRDVELFRAANVNVIRTSHYPPSEAFLDACDELGMFVECEAAVCWIGGEVRSVWKTRDASDPALFNLMEQPSLEMITAYREYPCIIAWSPANETVWSPTWGKVVAAMRQLDSSRPIFFHDQAWGAKHNQHSTADVANYHYPAPGEWPKLGRPIWFGEYGHVQAYNRRELETDPFIREDWGRRLGIMVDAIWQRDDVLGGCIWAGIDDVFHLPDGNLRGYGHWGILDGWRRTKPEYHGTFEAYSPVRVLERTAAPGEPVVLRVQNRFNFTNLNQTMVAWSAGEQGGTISADIAPHAIGEIRFPVSAGGPGWAMTLTVTDARGVIVARDVTRVAQPAAATTQALAADIDSSTALTTTMHALGIASTDAFVPVPMILPLDDNGGGNGSSRMLVNTIEPFTPVAPATIGAIDTQGRNDGLHFDINSKDAAGSITLSAEAAGQWRLAYALAVKQDVNPRQWGVVFTLPREFDTIDFDHETPWTWYPADSIGRAVGTSTANPVRRSMVEQPRVEPKGSWAQDANALGTNDFRATRAKIHRFALRAVDGRSLEIISPDASQSARAWTDGDHVRLLVAGFNTGGSDSFFANQYESERRPLKTGDVIKGNFKMRVTGAAEVNHALAFAGERVSPSPANRAPLEPAAFLPLPLGAVKADGWLQRQLQLQKQGLTGSAEQIYEALTPDSGWLGGKGENWEKGPYYIRGLIALAYTLDDPQLKERAQKWIDWALQSQKPDGSFGPAANDDWWPRMVVLWYLRDYYEATGDARVVPFFSKYFAYQQKELPHRPLRDWGRARAGDNIDIVLWTYNHTGDASLVELAKLLNQQATPWPKVFTDNLFYKFGEDFQPHHIVNVNQAMKLPPIAWQMTHDAYDKNAFAAGMANLDRQYGRIDGQISGTEQLSGLKSTDGVELCADIERIISDGRAVDILGDPVIADQMEKVAYNSLPAHTSPRMQQITYYQLLNQIAAVRGGHGFHEDYDNGNVPGPHSGFPCCCYNWHAGWPTLVKNLWAATPDGGLAAIAYGPSQVSGPNEVHISEVTDYPFDGTIKLTMNFAADRPKTFPLVLRVPGWCDAPAITVNGEAVANVKPGTFHRIERAWRPNDTIVLDFPMTVRTSTWTQNTVGLERGPLAFALAIKEEWKRVHDYLADFDEYEVTPQSAWNYGLNVDRAKPKVSVTTRPVGDVPWDTAAPPVTLSLSAKRLPNWGLRTMPGRVVFGKADHAWKMIGDAHALLDPSQPHHLRIEAKGKQIRVFVDAVQAALIDNEDASYNSGKIGLRVYNTPARYADLKLNGHPISLDNNDWQSVSGKWQVNGNSLVAERASDGKLVFKMPTDASDFTLEATINVASGGDAGVIFRASDLTGDVDGYRGYYVGLAPRPGKSQDSEEPPMSPVVSDQPTENVELIPFGSAKLRVSYFPVLK